MEIALEQGTELEWYLALADITLSSVSSKDEYLRPAAPWRKNVL
jgi:hypothetical protein